MRFDPKSSVTLWYGAPYILVWLNLWLLRKRKLLNIIQNHCEVWDQKDHRNDESLSMSHYLWVIIFESLSMSHNLWIKADGSYEAWNIDFLFDHHSLNIHVNNHVVMFLTAVEPLVVQKPIVYSTGKNVLFINLCPLGSEKVNWK